MNENNKTLILAIIGIIFFILIIITGFLIGVGLILSSQKSSPTPTTTTTTEVPITAPPITKVSKFASDAGLLKIRDDLKSTQTKIDTMDLFEQQITPPVMDLNISIAPQN